MKAAVVTGATSIEGTRFDFRMFVTPAFPLEQAQRALTLRLDRTDNTLPILLTM